MRRTGPRAPINVRAAARSRDAATLAHLRKENTTLRRSLAELERCDPRRALSSRERILRSATRLFSEHGYVGTTTRQMARHAGVSLATISQLFSDKQGVYGEVVASLRALELEEIGRLQQESRTNDYQSLGHAERFRVIFPQWVSFHFDHPEICRIELHRVIESQPSAAQLLLPADEKSLQQFVELVGQRRSNEYLRRAFLVANDLILTFVGGAKHHASVLSLEPDSREYRDLAITTIVEACARL